jgi:hypothetical protein
MQQIDYLTPDRRPKPFTSINLTIGLSVIVTAVLIIAVFVLPRFDQIFMDFRCQLPLPTRLVMRFSRWCNGGFGWALLLSIPIVVPIVITQLFWRPPKREESARRKTLLVSIVIGTVVLILIGTVLVLFLPTIPLIESVGAPSGHALNM